MDERSRIRTLLLVARLGRIARDEIRAFRDAQLRRLVAHAYARVFHYRRRFDAHGVRPDDIRTAEDLARLPLTSRHEPQDLPLSDLLDRGADPARLIERHTSGSAGRPLSLYSRWGEARIAPAIRFRALHDLGARAPGRRAGNVVRGPAPCRCGAPFSSMAGVEGCTWDTFVPANGRMVHRNLLVRAAATLGHAWVRQFQVVHDRRDRVVVKIVPVGTPPGADLARMRASMSDSLGPDTELEIRLAAGIELEANGKFRVARSLAVAR